MPNRTRHGSTRRWRAMRRVVQLRLLIAGSLPCYRCGQPVIAGQPFDVDHRTPVVIGGTDSMSNLAPAHPFCNRSAGSQLRRDRIAPPPSRDW